MTILAGFPQPNPFGVAVCAKDKDTFIALTTFNASGTLDLTVRGATGGANITGLTLAAGSVIRLEWDPVTKKATPYHNGVAVGTPGGYLVTGTVSVFDGVQSVGIWARNSSAQFDNWEGGTLGTAATLSCSTGPAQNSVLQRTKNTTSKSVAVGGAYTGTAPTDIQWRLENEAGTLITGYDWSVISGATIGSGAWSGSVTIPQDAARAGYIIKLRSRDSGAATIATAQSQPFTVGLIVEFDGQSNTANAFTTGGGPGISARCSYYTAGAWTRSFGGGISAAIMNLSDLIGLPVGFAHTAVGSTGIREHTPAHTSTDGAIAAGGRWVDTTALLTALGGDVECSLWFQGENEAGSGALTSQQYQDALNARIAAIKTTTGRTAAGEYSHGVVPLTTNPGGNDANWQTIRTAIATVGTTTSGAFIAADAITHAKLDGLHLTGAGYAELGYAEGRSAAVARGVSTYDGRGPRVASASIAGSTVTVAFTLNGSTALTGTGTLTGWEFFNGTAWAAATDATRSGNTVTFTGAGATQVRYLYGANPDVTNVVRGDVKAAAASAANLPAEPTRLAVSVSAGGTIAGVSSINLSAMTASGAGSVRAAGSAAQTLQGISLSSVGTVQSAGGLSQSLQGVGLLGSGTVRVTGTAAQALQGIGLSAAGGVRATGTTSATLAPATLVATGILVDGDAANGSLAATLAPATVSASGATPVAGTLSRTLDGATLAAGGTVRATGQAGTTLGGLHLVAAGGVLTAAGAAIVLEGMTAAGAGGVAVRGALATSLADATVQATAYAGDGSRGQLNATLDDVGLQAAGAVLFGFTPSAARTLAVPGEDRRQLVKAENRIYKVA